MRISGHRQRDGLGGGADFRFDKVVQLPQRSDAHKLRILHRDGEDVLSGHHFFNATS